MKAWEKWFDESSIVWKPSFPGFTFDDVVEASKLNWKEALKWVLEYDELCCECLKDIIEEELKGE